MKKIHILNPVAGKGAALKYKSNDYNDLVHITQSIGDAEDFVYKQCLEEPETHFVVYGGDGTLNEVVNGIMKSGANKTARISVVPVGTGNDFVKSVQGEVTVDVMRYNDKYAVNIINIGFDCDVVIETDKIKKKPLISGSLAYILGVVVTLCKKPTKHFEICLTDIAENEITYSDKYLCAVIANGSYYGGGFKAASLARTDDGILDFMIIKNISRFAFLKLVGDYKKGTHMDKELYRPAKKYIDVINYHRCKKVRIDKIEYGCVDGEIMGFESLEIEVIEKAITFCTLQ